MRKKKQVVKNVTDRQAEEALKIYATASKTIEVAKTIIDNQFEVLEVYAKENGDLFKNRKSLELKHGTIGFRTGTPKVKWLRGISAAEVLERIKKYLPTMFIREEVNKLALIAQRNDPAVTGNAVKCGFEIVQEESFFVDPKAEEAKS